MSLTEKNFTDMEDSIRALIDVMWVLTEKETLSTSLRNVLLAVVADMVELLFQADPDRAMALALSLPTAKEREKAIAEKKASRQA